jgi:LytS/YehU family sensor histidine kinase
MVTELKMLKSQINPHFFFNSLNSIYSLALENNPKTPEVVLQLSELMRYVLYDSSADRVDLKSEIVFLKNYVELEKSRFESSIRVEFSYNDNLPESVKIAPLLFIPFIENAFKHCNKGGANIPEIIIQVITSKLPAVELVVENSREPNISEHKQNGGVGLENAKKRLELIYPDHHKLKVVEEENKFLINLEIDLS